MVADEGARLEHARAAPLEAAGGEMCSIFVHWTFAGRDEGRAACAQEDEFLRTTSPRP